MFMGEELSNVSKQQTKLIELMNEVKCLKTIIKEKDTKIQKIWNNTRKWKTWLFLDWIPSKPNIRQGGGCQVTVGFLHVT